MAASRDMTARRMMAVPWWVFLLLSPVAYVSVAYAVPLILRGPHSTVLRPAVVQVFAPFIALLLLLLAALLGLHQLRARRLLDAQTGIDSIRSLPWRDFERLVGEAYRRQGYAVIETGSDGPDQGIDLVATKDGRHLIQCKHWKAYRVGVREVRELFGVVTAEGAASGILVTSGRFTEEARVFARRNRIELIDGGQLVHILEHLNPGHEFTSEVDERDVPSGRKCPRCGRNMVIRTARRGQHAGRQFWGCSGFPQCRETAVIPN